MENDILLMSDKIYSVLGILLLIFGILIYMLYSNEKKIKNLEDKLKNK